MEGDRIESLSPQEIVRVLRLHRPTVINTVHEWDPSVLGDRAAEMYFRRPPDRDAAVGEIQMGWQSGTIPQLPYRGRLFEQGIRDIVLTTDNPNLFVLRDIFTETEIVRQLVEACLRNRGVLHVPMRNAGLRR